MTEGSEKEVNYKWIEDRAKEFLKDVPMMKSMFDSGSVNEKCHAKGEDINDRTGNDSNL